MQTGAWRRRRRLADSAQVRLTGLMALGAAALSLATFSLAAPAHAALGGALSSVDADRAQMRATRMLSVTHATHAVHSMTLGSGGTIQEYANSDGVVFAVAWSGPGKPDLRQLLGDRFERMQAGFAAGGGRRARTAVTLTPGDFVIHMGGQPGAFHGAAYLPGLVPDGFDLGLLR